MNDSNKHDHQAAAWMARRLSGRMPEAELREFEEWLEQDEQNRAAFKAYEIAAGSLDHAEEDLLTQSFEKELGDLAAAQNENATPWRSIAATGLIAVILSIALSVSFFTKPESQSYVTAYGERAEHKLDDGSSVQLNTNSDLEIVYSKSKRLAQIDSGEALFNVRRNPDRPFVVETRHGDIVVTGTVFNVLSMAKGTIVSVVSGAVDVSPNAGPRITILAGQRLRIDEYGRGGGILNFDPNRALAWRDGKVRFENQPLNIVLDDLNRYFERPIILGDASLASLPVTGEFDISDQQIVINALSIAFSLDHKQEPSRVILVEAEK